MCEWFKAKILGNRITNSIDFFSSKLNNATAFHTNEVVVIRHTRTELKVCTIALKPVLHEDTALCQKVQRRINGRTRDTVSLRIHIHIELVSAKVSVQFCNPVQDLVPFLGVTVLFAFEKVGKLLFKRFDVWR